MRGKEDVRYCILKDKAASMKERVLEEDGMGRKEGREGRGERSKGEGGGKKGEIRNKEKGEEIGEKERRGRIERKRRGRREHGGNGRRKEVYGKKKGGGKEWRWGGRRRRILSSYHNYMLLCIPGCFHGNIHCEGCISLLCGTPEGEVVQHLRRQVQP